MRKSWHVALITVLLSVVTVVLLSGCNSGDEGGRKPMTKKELAMKVQTMLNDAHRIGPTMSKVLTADTLYTCPNHPAVVTSVPNQKCPIGGETLVVMKKSRLKQLRESQPVGCPTCPIVVSGHSRMTNCPICGMELEDVRKDSTLEMEEDMTGHDTGL